MNAMERIFISYKRADGEKVYKLIDKIEKTLGVKCWYDLDGIETAAQFMSKICTAIDNAEVVLFMHSSAHLGINYEKDWTVKELNYAHMTKKRVVLVKLDDAPLKNLFLMEYGTRNNIDSRRPDQWEKLMKDLSRWLNPSDSKPKVYSDAELKDLYNKGDEFYNKKLYPEAVECYRKAAEQGYAAAQNELGWMYQNGYGVTEDYGEAVKWYRKAAEQGNATAQYNLGIMYKNGYGVTKDYGEAVRWYRKAAEQGRAAAQYNLGDMYQYGYGVKKDLAQARYWYQKAADHGHERAKRALAGL
jgi:hypothetical protein